MWIVDGSENVLVIWRMWLSIDCGSGLISLKVVRLEKRDWMS